MDEGYFSVLSPEMRLEIFSWLFESKDAVHWRTVVQALRVNKRWKEEMEWLWYRFCQMHKLLQDEIHWSKKGKNWKWLSTCRLTQFTDKPVVSGFGWRSGDGHRYEGEWSQDQKHGVGCMWWGEDRYIGDWEHGSKTGHGLMIWGNGDMYDGSWNKDLRHGKATYLYHNGGKYQGGYEADDRSGEGVFVWPDGDFFSGTWRVGGRTGLGSLTTATGETFPQEWSETPTVNYSSALPPKFPDSLPKVNTQ